MVLLGRTGAHCQAGFGYKNCGEILDAQGTLNRAIFRSFLIIALVGCANDNSNFSPASVAYFGGAQAQQSQPNKAGSVRSEIPLETPELEPSMSLQRSRVIARNLVAAMRQIPEFIEADSRLSIAWPASDFAKVLAAELQTAGFKLHLAKNQQSPSLLTHSVSNPVNGAHGARDYLFMLRLDQVVLSRLYRVSDSTVTPISSTRVMGSTIDSIALRIDDSLFYPLR